MRNEFSIVLGPESTQHDVYLACGQKMVSTVFGGKNACLFAYGQTAGGKTYSLFGSDGGKNASRLDGIVPQLASELFRKKGQVGTPRERCGASGGRCRGVCGGVAGVGEAFAGRCAGGKEALTQIVSAAAPQPRSRLGRSLGPSPLTHGVVDARWAFLIWQLEKKQENRYAIRCSCTEVYGQQIRDLLAKEATPPTLKMRGDLIVGAHVEAVRQRSRAGARPRSRA